MHWLKFEIVLREAVNPHSIRNGKYQDDIEKALKCRSKTIDRRIWLKIVCWVRSTIIVKGCLIRKMKDWNAITKAMEWLKIQTIWRMNEKVKERAEMRLGGKSKERKKRSMASNKWWSSYDDQLKQNTRVRIISFTKTNAERSWDDIMNNIPVNFKNRRATNLRMKRLACEKRHQSMWRRGKTWKEHAWQQNRSKGPRIELLQKCQEHPKKYSHSLENWLIWTKELQASEQNKW